MALVSFSFDIRGLADEAEANSSDAVVAMSNSRGAQYAALLSHESQGLFAEFRSRSVLLRVSVLAVGPFSTVHFPKFPRVRDFVHKVYEAPRLAHGLFYVILVIASPARAR